MSSGAGPRVQSPVAARVEPMHGNGFRLVQVQAALPESGATPGPRLTLHCTHNLHASYENRKFAVKECDVYILF